MASAAGGPAHSGVSPFDIRGIPATTHLFFDDEQSVLGQVDGYVADYNHNHPTTPIDLQTVLCAPGEIELVSDGVKVPLHSVADYKKHKIIKEVYTSFTLRDTFGKFKDNGIGSGLTIPLIDQIIEFEKGDSIKTRLYFFDFDKLLSQVGSLLFISPDAEQTKQYISEYAHFLFSDHVQIESPSSGEAGRLTRLKEMFRLIGPERVFIVTCNGAALNSKTKPPIILNRELFMRILQELLPNIKSEHVKHCNVPDKDGKVIPNKGKIIVDFIVGSRVSKGGKKATSRKRKYTRRMRRKSITRRRK